APCTVYGSFHALYGATFGCMAYCMASDPGQLRRSVDKLPRRCHKAWTHHLPIRRYDHYCRWLMNCIGLLNHREFFTMLAGLQAIAVLGILVDAALVVQGSQRVLHARQCFLILLHLVLSTAASSIVHSVLRLHIGFISRNELCSEWRDDKFARIGVSTRRWDGVLLKDHLGQDEFDRLNNCLVRHLSAGEFNDFDVDSFVYDPLENDFDRGFRQNWYTFWCRRRWDTDELGEF
ncbi:unnamed protein product, partial [Polarella glacialis]